MTEIELAKIKKTMEEARELGITNWNTDTISSLITTIESLQKEKDQQHDTFYNEVRIAHQEKEMSSHRHALYAGELREKIESQKEEIEKLREIQRVLVLAKM